MKFHSPTFLLFGVALSLVGCASLPEKSPQDKGAHLGQTEAQITRELGAPKAHYMNGFLLFHENGNEVQVHFQGGKADSLFYYTFGRKISDPWLSSTLKLNSKGAPWVLEASSKSGKKVYRTADGKYRAFVSKANQLMVDTDPFFQKALHRPGKTIPVDELPECVFAPDHQEARIGDTEATVIRNYGQSIDTATDGAKEYRNGYQDIMVHYKEGRCDAVLYTADKGALINDCWVSGLQQMNSVNAWVVAESSKPNNIYYWTPKDSLVANLIERRGLIVYTLDYGKDQNRRPEVNGKRTKYFPATITPSAPIWLGETEEAMTKKLGQTRLEKYIRVYRDGDLIIRARFDHGACVGITYISERKRKFTNHWVSSTLAVNSRGRAWFTFESSTPKKSFYRTYDHKFYAQLREGYELRVKTEAFLKKALREHKEEMQRSESATVFKS